MPIETALVLPAESTKLEHLQQIAERAQQTIDNAKASSTRRVYTIAWSDFASYCDVHEFISLPAHPGTVVLYLNHLAFDRGQSVSTIAQRLAAIRHYHENAGEMTPTGAPIVSDTMKGIRRELTIAQRRKSPLSLAQLEQIIKLLSPFPIGIRDAALLTVGFFGGFRRSELTSLNLSDITFDDRHGATALVRRSKTDQLGEGLLKALPYKIGRCYCPVTALQRWLEFRGNVAGALFCSVSKGGHVTGRRLDGKEVGRILERGAEGAGIILPNLGAHSLRVGFVTEARRRGADTAEIMNQTGHKTERMINLYTRSDTVWEMNAVTRL